MNRTIKTALFFALSLTITSVQSAEKDEFKPFTAKVTSANRPDLIGKILTIEGTSKTIWNIDDVWMSSRAFGIYAIKVYIFSHPPFNGTVYYGKDEENFGHCVHEDWIEKL